MFIFYKRLVLVVLVYLLIRIMVQRYVTISQRRGLLDVPKVKHISVNSESRDDKYQCHYFKHNGFLSEITEDMTFPSNSIFFIENSCSDLTSRQACSVESAARANPDRQVIVLSTSPKSPKNIIIKKLLSLNNTSILRIHLENYAEGSPLDIKFRKKPITFEDLNMDLADILKFLTLYKYSGVYLTMDVIVARNFDKLSKNWIVKENLASVNSDMFCFSENFNGRAMANVALNVIANNLAIMENKFMFRLNRNFAMKQFVNMWCGVTDILFLNASQCQDLDVGLPENFVPIPFRSRYDYFKPGTLDQFKNQLIYTYEIWESYTSNYPVNEDSLYTRLAKAYCPVTYSLYGNKFGKQ